MGVADYGTAAQTTASPSLADWAASVAAALDASDVTVDARDAAAQAAAEATAAAALAEHEADTTAVHGIADTSALALTGDAPTAHAASHASAGSDPVTVAQSQVTSLTTDLAAKAPLASPTFTGTPAAPTAATGTNTTQIATTAFVAGKITVSRPSTDDVVVSVRGADGTAQTAYSDTGWRDVSADVTNATIDSGGALQMRRVNATVSIRVLTGLLPTGTGLASIIYAPPAGFRPNGQTFITRGRRSSNPAVVYDFGIVDGFGIYVPVLPASSCLFTLNYVTDDTWPTSLPGTLVSAAPA